MLIKDKKIAIIGGGPGGLTLARLLQLKGVEVKVYERDTDRYARVQGSPLDLHEESGLAALEKAGLMQVFKENFMPGADREKIVNEKAEVFFSDHDNKPESQFGQEHFRPEIDRGVLRQILLDSLEAETVVWNSHFTSMESESHGWRITFNDGRTAYADFVVAADGANSKIRPYLTPVKPFYSGITMLEGNILNARSVAPKMTDFLAGGKIMAFGNEQNILMGQKAGGEIGFYASFRAPENWASASGIDFSDHQQVLKWFKDSYSDWNEIWHELFENATGAFIPRPIYCMPLDQYWEAKPDLTLLGDAAHIMPPFAGEGVNMAMLDALELSEKLCSDEGSSITRQVAEYENSMRKRAARAADESLRNGDMMHSKDALINMVSFFSRHFDSSES